MGRWNVSGVRPRLGVNGDRVEATYRHSGLFEERHELMDDWAAHLTAADASGASSAGRPHSDAVESGSERAQKSLTVGHAVASRQPVSSVRP